MPLNRLQEKGLGAPASDAQVQSPTAFAIQENAPLPISPEFYPGKRRSLSGIALRAFLLGNALAFSAIVSLALAYYQSRLWRPLTFVATLCLFHFLEFWTTARYNTPIATVSSYLLTNGDRYRQAHTFAFLESLFTSYFFPQWQARVNPPSIIALGFAITFIGQAVRSLAMVQAGTNFNHQVQSRKNQGHELVTTGLYSVFRHPAYFGYFWWALGTQIVLGNAISLIGFTAVLWYFFHTRIQRKALPSLFPLKVVVFANIGFCR